MKTVAIIQARMGSSRLPGKVMQELAGRPMLERVLHRVSRASTLSEVVVATTTNERDDTLAHWCEARNWPCFRGSEDDVLDRYYGAACAYSAEIVVRITSDCPLIDPSEVDSVVRALVEARPSAHYSSNSFPIRTFPRGLDAEAMLLEVLEEAWKCADSTSEREHVTPFIYRRPERFAIRSVTSDVDHSEHRWTVDTLEDLQLARRIYDHFDHDDFSWHDTLDVLARHPEWVDLNRHILQKPVR
jgi:spore coat polysaccharide biosynthesis protein SpsF